MWELFVMVLKMLVLLGIDVSAILQGALATMANYEPVFKWVNSVPAGIGG